VYALHPAAAEVQDREHEERDQEAEVVEEDDAPHDARATVRVALDGHGVDDL
jgi:hypothetical protein